jgi:hypothetical protein
MTRDEIIRMAQEADLLVVTPIPDDCVFVADLERFATLVAAAEREACANEADYWIGFDKTASQACAEIATAIRARGQQ